MILEICSVDLSLINNDKEIVFSSIDKLIENHSDDVASITKAMKVNIDDIDV